MGKRHRESEKSHPDSFDKEVGEDTSKPVKRSRGENKNPSQRTLFVRSLPATATSENFTAFFSQNYPLKHATVVLDPETKQSKGYGFVTFADAEDAQKAQEHMNGTSFMGRKIKIEIAEPRSRELVDDSELGGMKRSKVTEEAAAAKNARRNILAEKKAPPKLIIRNLPWSVKSSDQLAKLFDKFGKIKFSTLPKIKEGTQAGFGFITMRSKKSAETAIKMLNNTTVDGRIIAVDWAVDKSTWEKRSKEDNSIQNTKELEDQAGTDTDDIKNEPCVKSKDCVATSASLSNQEENDVSNFFKNFGDQLESDVESGFDSSISDTEDSLGPSLRTNDASDSRDENAISKEKSTGDKRPQKTFITDNSTTLFIRNLPFTTLDENLKQKFEQFGPVRYSRVVMDRNTGRPKGTGFVCFYNLEDAESCYRGAPRTQPSGANCIKLKNSILEDESTDSSGMYSIEGRVLQVSRAVDRENATKLTESGKNFRSDRDKDKRKLFLLKEGTIAAGTPLYNSLSSSEIKMREDSAMQRKKLTQNNPALHLSLTRLSVRNIPRHLTSKDLKALARESVVGFAKDVKSGLRAQLSKEEESRGGEEDRIAEQQRKSKGKGIVRQAKIVFEGREGNKIAEDSGAGRSRGYGFIEYYSHRWALMGLRWMNGHAVQNNSGKTQRLIVEFAIENAQVVQRRKLNEEKARLRSQEVLKAREKGEAPEKEKKILRRDQVMAKMRKGTKDKHKKNERQVKSLENVSIKMKNPDSKDRKLDIKDRKVSKKSHIIQRSSQLRRVKRNNSHK
ncbi:putative RNA-binding protein C4F6.14 [Golovinomyces cichoracearum]|uniref:Putative RNA-binding protein C4F6.14 n=1 Tax=Golovinomyces cichoracearum TaxID=62708 RepID=A0A420IXJ4_9PEZI|nr:putative RNA-binding protein C4F6.14 [Golovinomyces cichoracearum]